MASKKHERRIARESALAILYSCDITQADIKETIENGNYPDEDFVFPEYAERLLLGVAEKQDEIDGYLVSTSENWALDRMPVIDRSILRLALYEMIFIDEVPVSVAINEAVELAKGFGGEDESSRFVNGILGRIARMLDLEGLGNAGEACPDDAQTAGQEEGA